MRSVRRRAHLGRLGALLAVGLVGGCGDGELDAAPFTTNPRVDSASATSALSGDITVFAAASLTDVFQDLGSEFETSHPGVEVRFSFGASSDLATQIVEGAPADVLAAASTATMETVTEAGLGAGGPMIFATNQLEIAVPPDNPGQVESLEDLANADLIVALCAPEVPCGSAAEHLLDLTDVQVEPDSREEDVRAALTKVQLGEVDAALVYRSDVIAAGKTVIGIEVPESGQAINRYPIVALSGAASPDLAAEFVEFVLSDTAADVFEAAGFGTP